MKRHLFTLYFLLQVSSTLPIAPTLDEAAFNFVRDVTTGVRIQLDQVKPEVIQQVGSLFDAQFSLQDYEGKDADEKLGHLFDFGKEGYRIFRYNLEPYRLRRDGKYIRLLDKQCRPILPNPTGAASQLYMKAPETVNHISEASQKNDLNLTPKTENNKSASDPEPKCALRPHLCASFGKALCAATITGIGVYYALGLYNKNTQHKQQPLSQKKWALLSATVVGLSTFAYVHSNISQ